MSGDKPDFIKMANELPVKVNLPAAIGVGVVLILALWLVQGGPAYTVAPDEEGVVLTFGKYTKTTGSGFHFKWPWPIQTVEKPKIAEVKRLEFGFQSRLTGGQTSYIDFTGGNATLLAEARMLTGDENVVDCSMAVQYRLSDSIQYLFNFRVNEVAAALHDIGEASLRQAVGDRPIDHVLTTHKLEIQTEIQLKMQELADKYGMGVRIDAVQLQDVLPPKDVEAAFQEVATAREEREKIENQARGYQNEQIPRARGKAKALLLNAEAYKDATIAKATGEVARFLALAEQYETAPDLTRTRMYLDTMNELLPKMKITIVDDSAGLINLKSLGGGALPVTQGPAGGGTSR